ncbi:hydrolase [uncultured Allofournierella sp.]|uniref:hydrolase n=1 Tax=uncultured Allofournierella sp. TaxID=1940258 RepID=UPI0025DAA022|nr:hydrolase [uncultured Fournierella sp.]
MPIDINTNAARFSSLYLGCAAGRPGAEEFLEWLGGTDFFTAPASTRFHLSEPGGLCQHSLNVYSRMIQLVRAVCPDDAANMERTAGIVSLLHDVCKAGFYGTEMRNKKDESGKWIQVPFYTVDDKFPYGHGEKSVFLIERFMRLTTEEAVAIRWHMGGFDEAVRGGSYSVGAAYDKYPLALLLHMADMMASHFDEAKEDK